MKQTPTRFPKINQFETQFSHLSLSNFPEQKHNPSICKGMLSMINPKGPCENTKIKKQCQLEDMAQCKKRCQQDLGSSFDLDLSVFKIRPCQRQCEHNHKQCPYFHSENDLRRAGTYYKPEMCPYKSEKKECPYGYSCCKSHNQYEQLYQEDVYRKQFCPQPQNCCYGMFCPFAHEDKDIKCELIHLYYHDVDYFLFHYKTVSCPYALINHNLYYIVQLRSTCHYYHSDADQRRKPNIIQYQPEYCQNISQKQSCKQDCQSCHNAYEYYYHPFIYKTYQCQQLQSCNQSTCSGFHDQYDLREISPLVKSGIMKFVPKNRYEEYQIRQQSIRLPSIY